MTFASLTARLTKTAAAALVALTAFAPALHAAPYSFTISGTGAGELGNNSFKDTAFLIELFGDDAKFTKTDSTQIFDPLEKAQVTIGKLGTAVFQIDTRLGYNTRNNAVFFSRAQSSGSSDLFDFYVKADSSFVLTDAFTDLAGQNVFALNQFNLIATSLGALSFSQADGVLFGSDGGKPATAPLPSAVPLPMSGLLLLGGLAAPVALRLRRKA
ncbi:hypothetical protein DKT77_08835 [Meridianimarinicoccus roseus]|uniref:VPLPA-CTERM protein sorting domain-containing protein n=1 Tax=Meridianimarinicoccus roseus TaxID=2072018 RepID=A0A2V2LMR9_9RHOB|nr:hypothetical protein [Meridianimarinicoccus roseus]PWR03033.1 hypothetical protein DKT77_08835 [Meridianimarinicoccus roseus]